MACGKVLFCFALLVNLSVILAEEGADSKNQNPSPSEPQREEHGSLDERFIPFLTPFANIFSQFANSTGLPFSSFLNSRSQGIDIETDNQTDSNEHSDRFFFRFPRFVGCNYTENPGLACYSCRQRVNCLRSNVGIVTRCSFFLPYCSGNGTCSQTPGSLC
ncbi:uncharacterized protein LOC113231264 [Hyposmocoma kahamanoa]|uniref:uncharacterized protein LOC113231264 n=1 Tax=Hyposmocoma kahamanoa TaxID=1477025 RepID=UPI000E6DA20D|nr:uncharacterized protein LOC113231264 [Hyposmocoma kahamanoa]